MGQVPSRSHQLSGNAPPKVRLQGSCVMSNDGLIPVREIGKRRGFLRWLFLLVRQKGSWSPAAIAGESWRFFINIGLHREILRLLKLRPFDEIAQNNPGFAFKYVVPNYLARGFTIKERASCFLHHYRRMYAALPEYVLHQILQGDVRLHEIAEGRNCFALSIGSPELIADREGELSLDLRVMAERSLICPSPSSRAGW